VISSRHQIGLGPVLNTHAHVSRKKRKEGIGHGKPQDQTHFLRISRTGHTLSLLVEAVDMHSSSSMACCRSKLERPLTAPLSQDSQHRGVRPSKTNFTLRCKAGIYTWLPWGSPGKGR